jgi:putative glutamine amidotransferase
MKTVGIIAGSDDRGQLSLHPGFAEAVLSAGGLPILLPKTYGGRSEQLEDILRIVDALILVGGGDISCDRYKETPVVTLQDVDPVRDGMEIYAAQWAVKNNVRVLGVCRGAQILAVATGGSLHQDLPAAGFHGHLCDYLGAVFAAMRHRLTIQEGTLAARVFEDVDEVNSHHHQAVSDPGPFLQATGWSDDGVIEVVEAGNVLGIQWHPELLFADDRRSLRPFAWLVGDEERVELSTSAGRHQRRTSSLGP